MPIDNPQVSQAWYTGSSNNASNASRDNTTLPTSIGITSSLSRAKDMRLPSGKSITPIGGLSWMNGCYKGQLLNGEPHGYGKLTTPTGNGYDGNWKNGLPDGYGIYSSEHSKNGFLLQDGKPTHEIPQETTITIKLNQAAALNTKRFANHLEASRPAKKSKPLEHLEAYQYFSEKFSVYQKNGGPGSMESFRHFETVFNFDGSSAVSEYNVIQKNQLDLKKVIALLVRKSAQNIPHQEWLSLKDNREKVQLIHKWFQLAVKFVGISEHNDIKQIKAYCENTIGLKNIEEDHLIAKQTLILIDYLTYANDGNDNFGNVEYFKNAHFPKYMPRVAEFENKMKEQHYEDHAPFRQGRALGLIVGLPDPHTDCGEHVFELECPDIENNAFASNIPFQQLKDDLLLSNYKQVDLHQPYPRGSIIVYGKTDDQKSMIVSHYSKCLHEGLWSSKRGEGSAYLYIDPHFDHIPEYGDIIGVFQRKQNDKDKAFAPRATETFPHCSEPLEQMTVISYESINPNELFDDGYNSDVLRFKMNNPTHPDS